MKHEIISRKDAASAGKKFYFTGVPCVRGHVELRYVHGSICTICTRDRANKWQRENPSKVLERNRRSYKRNSAKVIARTSRYSKSNPTVAKASFDRYRRKHQAKYNEYCAKYRALRNMAIPKWANRGKIAEFYELARFATEESGIQMEVDHEVPIKSKLVCGLHWEGNLRVITAKENASKKNYYWTGM